MSIYSCWTDNPNAPRGRPTEQWMQDGWSYGTGSVGQMTREPVMRIVRTDWTAMRCGALQQVGVAPDANCNGCANRIGGDHGA